MAIRSSSKISPAISEGALKMGSRRPATSVDSGDDKEGRENAKQASAAHKSSYGAVYPSPITEYTNILSQIEKKIHRLLHDGRSESPASKSNGKGLLNSIFKLTSTGTASHQRGDKKSLQKKLGPKSSMQSIVPKGSVASMMGVRRKSLATIGIEFLDDVKLRDGGALDKHTVNAEILKRARKVQGLIQKTIAHNLYTAYLPLLQDEIHLLQSQVNEGNLTKSQFMIMRAFRSEVLKRRVSVETERKMLETCEYSLRELSKREMNVIRSALLEGEDWEDAVLYPVDKTLINALKEAIQNTASVNVNDEGEEATRRKGREDSNQSAAVHI